MTAAHAMPSPDSDPLETLGRNRRRDPRRWTHKRGRPSREQSDGLVSLPLPRTHLKLAELLTEFLAFEKRGISAPRFLSELLQNELERWFEDVSGGMTLGEYLRLQQHGGHFALRRAAGEPKPRLVEVLPT